MATHESDAHEPDETSEVKQSPYRWTILSMCFLANFFAVGWIWFSVPVLLPAISEDLGIQVAAATTIFSAIAFSLIFTNIPGGVLGDRYSIKWVIGGGIILGGIVGILRWAVPTYTGQLVASLVYGIAVALVFPNLVKVLTQWFSPVQLGLAQGVNLVGFNIGAGIVETISAGVVLEMVGGWANVFLAYGVITLVVGVAWLLLVRSPRPDEEPETPSHLIAAEEGHGSATGSIVEMLRELFSLRVTYLLGAVALLVLYAFNGYLGLIPTWAEQTAFHVPHVVIGGPLFAAAVGALLLPALSDSLGRKEVLYSSVIGAVFGIILTIYASSLAVFTLGVALGGMFIGGLLPLLLTLPGEHPKIGAARSGTMAGVIFAIGQVGGTISPVLSGRVLSSSGIFASGVVLALPLFLAVIPIRLISVE